MIAEGYADARTLKRRINALEDWIANGREFDSSSAKVAIFDTWPQ